jgi:hypothetical protein
MGFPPLGRRLSPLGTGSSLLGRGFSLLGMALSPLGTAFPPFGTSLFLMVAPAYRAAGAAPRPAAPGVRGGCRRM